MKRHGHERVGRSDNKRRDPQDVGMWAALEKPQNLEFTPQAFDLGCGSAR